MELTVHVEDQFIVLTDVPAWVCFNCDEAYISFETSKKADKIVEKVTNKVYLAKPIAEGEISLSSL